MFDHKQQLGNAILLSQRSPGSLRQDRFILQALRTVSSDEERQALLEIYFQEQATRILGTKASRLDPQRPLNELGLDSLAAVELKGNLGADLGIDLPLEDFLRGASLSDLATRALACLAAPADGSPPIRAGKGATEHPLSHGQQALWFLQRLDAQSSAYNIAGAGRIRTDLDVALLRSSFQTLLDRHSALRTGFAAAGDGGPVQTVHCGVEVRFQHVDASACSGADLQKAISQVAGRPFDLGGASQLRVCLYRRSREESVLLLAVHHIVADLWSLSLLLQELGEIYSARKEGRPAQLPRLQYQFTDYVRWQADLLAGPQGTCLQSFWCKQLVGQVPILELPTDKPRPPVQTFRGGCRRFRLDAQVTEGLEALARRQGATLYMTLLAAFQSLLHRFTGQDRILVGSPAAGRSRSELNRLVGYFVNPVVVAADFSARPCFLDLIDQIAQTATDALEHQDYPFALLVSRLQPQRDPSRSPLFQAMFALQKPPAPDEGAFASLALGIEGPELKLGRLSLQAMAMERQVAQFDLRLDMARQGDALMGSLQYNADLFEATSIGRLADCLQRLVKGLISQPLREIAALPLLEPQHRHQFLEWNDSRSAPEPVSQCLPGLIEQQAAKAPQAMAAVCGEQQVSYAQLDRLANRLAFELREQGTGCESLLGICVERSIEMLIGLLAILKSGGAYLPLDPASPKPRLARMLQDARVRLLLTQQHLLPNLPAPGDIRSLLVSQWPAQGRRASRPGGRIPVASRAYVIYTSGSTGFPKGVQVSHCNLVNFLQSMQRRPGIREGDSLMAVTTVSFDIAALELYLPLLCGGRVVLASRQASSDGSLLGRMLTRAGASMMQATPATWRLLIDSGWTGLPGLRVLSGGEALPRELSLRLLYSGASSVWNLYGPTETTVWSAARRLEQGEPERTHDGWETLGRPIRNTQLYLLSKESQPQPVGVPGELFIGGQGVTRGYLNSPALTAARFIPDPWGGESGSRLYRTGDLARFLPDGDLQYLGRLDDQVKVRGFRVEPGEIESELAQHRQVRQALVTAQQDESGSSRLIAYVVPNRHGKDCSLRCLELRQFLRRRLPEYMLPSLFSILPAFPLTPNGKIDRKALPWPLQADRQAGDPLTPSRPFEQILAGIWSDLLGVEGVGPQDNFFDLGGHSLLATRMISRIAGSLAVELPLGAVFSEPVLSGLARRIEEAAKKGFENASPPLRPMEAQGADPLSFAQQRLWFLDRQRPGSSADNIPAALRLEGKLNRPALQAALGEIVRRHETLRTCFRQKAGQANLHLLPPTDFPLPLIDLSRLPAKRRTGQLKWLGRQQAGAPFDLRQDLLLRAHLARSHPRDHSLQATMHHIASDAWSAGVLLGELSALYNAIVAGQPSPLPPLPIRYADYAAWQRRRLRGKLLKEQLGYWKERLGRRPQPFQLPIARQRPAASAYHLASYSFDWPRQLLQSLHLLSRREDMTLYMTLLAAFVALLARYSGQSDISVGSPIANRSRSETEGLIGFFVNSLVMRINLSGDPGFSRLLRRVRETALQAYSNQDVPFEKVVEAVQPQRSLQLAPLFQIVFVMQNAPRTDLHLQGLKADLKELDRPSTRLDLWLSFSEGRQGLQGKVEYAAELLDASAVQRMVGHLRRLLQAAADEPQRSIAALPLLSQAEQSQLVQQWNDTWAPIPADETIGEIFSAQLKRIPDALAAEAGGSQLSYAGLDRRSGRLARHLRGLGVGPETPVGSFLNRSLEVAVSVWAILKAGGVYLPLDPAYPLQRLSFMLEDAGVSIVLTGDGLSSRLPGFGAWTISLDSDWPQIAQQECLAEWIADAANLAYVIYTSGTTGRPKGVEVTHRGLRNLAVAQLKGLALPSGCRVLQFSSLGFDSSIAEMTMTWGAGAVLCLEEADRLLPGPGLMRLLKDRSIGVVTLPPSALLAMERQPLPALRRILAAGEACPAEAVARWADGTRFFNAYGPTETSVWATVQVCRPDKEGLETPSIGRPVVNFRTYVLDCSARSVALGVPGELCIGGPGLARGYLGRPALTAAKFVPDPFASEPGMRLYRTEDLVRLRPEGEIDFRGRIDQQLKIRGFRIEPGEIETALLENPGIQEAVVLARPDKSGTLGLVAYLRGGVKGRRGSQPQDLPARLRQSLRGKLPEYMLPSAFVMLEDFPRSASGKVDRKALLLQKAASSERKFVAPASPAEKLLAEIWREVLGVERASLHDDFFELGGHSLLATQIVTRIQKAFGVELPLQTLFESPRLKQMARRIEEAGPHRAAPAFVPVPRRQGRHPLSFAQQRLWFLDQLDPGSPLYNVPAALRLKGRLHLPALVAGLNEIVRRHESLRTRFPSSGGKPVQKVRPRLLLTVPLLDLRALATARREAELSRLIKEEAARPFDLEKGALLRTRLVRLKEEEQALLATMHHIVSDGWSSGILVRELAVLYEVFRNGEASPLPELQLQYTDYAHWQRQWLKGEVLESRLRYWKEALQGIPAQLELATDRARPAIQSNRGGAETFSWPDSLRNSFEALCQSCDSTPFMGLLAAFQILLHRHGCQEDIGIGTPIANRNRPETEAMIGLFVNTLVLRTDLSGRPSFQDLLQRVRLTALEAYANQDVPFDLVVEAVQPERSLSRTPLSQVLFAYQNFPTAQPRLKGLQVEQIIVEAGSSKSDLDLTVTEAEPGLQGIVEYSLDLFDPTTIRRMTRHLRRLAEAILDKPSLPINDLPLMSAGERHQVLTEWNDTQTLEALDANFNQLFSIQVECRPEAVAVGCRGVHLSYRELHQKAERMAHFLVGKGLGPDGLAALLAERGPGLLISILAALMTGGGYLPLDPNYPPKRIAQILQQSKASLVLTAQSAAGKLEEALALMPTRRIPPVESIEGQLAIEHPTDAPLAAAVDAGHLAYVIFTSGSTGFPKAAAISWAGFLNHLQIMVREFHLDASDVVAQNVSQCFDVSVSQFLFPLLVGGRVQILPQDVVRDPALLLQEIDRRSVTVLVIVPSLLSFLLEESESAHHGSTTLPALRLLMAGGETVSPKLCRKWLERFPKIPLVNSYGTTECADEATSHLVTQPPAETVSVPIGRPLGNLQVYVMDWHLNPAPPGVAGELCISGLGVGRGYLHDPVRTAEVFVPDPVSRKLGTRMYRTGDFTRQRTDGRFEFLGRTDHQVKLRGLRIELREVEAALTEHPWVKEALALVREDSPGNRRLTAYLVPEASAASRLQSAELRDFLSQALPEYMVPSALLTLDALPLTVNGKVDRQALPAPAYSSPDPAKASAPPRNPTESLLAEIWGELLDVPQLGVHDNFFELGGDSILSIQIVARARRAGLLLTPKHIFQHPTIAELARVAGRSGLAQTDQRTVEGEAPLTPIQRWFFETDLADRQHWNQSVLLEVEPSADLQAATVEAALQALLAHHDALRTRFFQSKRGWRQVVVRKEAAAPFCQLDHSALSTAERTPALAAATAQVQASLNLEQGPLLRAAWFDWGAGQPVRLLIVVHHLVVDGISWRILLEDLQAACLQTSRREAIELPPKSTSFKRWAERLLEYAQSQPQGLGRAYWLSSAKAPAAKLPLDYPQGHNLEASARSVVQSLSEEETRRLLQEIPQRYSTQINDVLLTALVEALADWTGRRPLLIALEGHGRQEIFEDLDLSRTVGWFTIEFPVLLSLGDPSASPGEALKSIKQQLRAIPMTGFGHGVLRYLNDGDEIARPLSQLPWPQLSFNYLGQFDQTLSHPSLFRPARESAGPPLAPRARRTYLLDVGGSVVDGRLQVEWTYSESLHRRTTIEALSRKYIQALQALIEHCRSAPAAAGLASDFPLARLDQASLDRLPISGRIEDLYPLSPMQQGMLLETVRSPAKGEYLEQVTCLLDAGLDAGAFQQAWQQAASRHPALRTAFLWKDLDEPLQAVYRRADLSWTIKDWQALAPEQQGEQLDDFLDEDRRRGFDLSQPPLMRLALIRLDRKNWRFVWTSHHLLMDGWSMPLLLQEVFHCYQAARNGRRPVLEPVRPYRDYIAWLQSQDLLAAQSYWSQSLAGFRAPTAFGVDRQGGSAADCRAGSHSRERRLSESSTASLQALARGSRLTVSTLVQGAWALLLSRYSGQGDVLFGVTVSGRPADLEGVEAIVGLFINTLPMRVKLSDGQGLIPWLAGIQERQAEMRLYEYSPLVEIRKWSQLPAAGPLFESNLVFEDGLPQDWKSAASELKARRFRPIEVPHFPLGLRAVWGRELLLKAHSWAERFEAEAVQRLLSHLQSLLEGMAEDPSPRLGDLQLLTPAERQQILAEWNDTSRPTGPGAALPGLLDAQCRRTPDSTASVLGGHFLTFGELGRRSSRLAHQLRELGVGADMAVGICLHRSLELQWGLLGILKAGGAYLPLDPAYPIQRISFMLEDAGASIVLTAQRLSERLPAYGIWAICLDSDWQAPAGQPTRQASAVTDPDNLAYLIYTSGSTGRPKGTMITHGGLSHYLNWCLKTYPCSAGRGAPVHGSISFDATVTTLFAPWLAGRATLVIPEEDGVDALAQVWREGGDFGFVKLTPAHLDMLADLIPPGKAAGRAQALILGGEALLEKSLSFWREHAPGTHLINEYGPTEASVGCCVFTAPAQAADSQAVPIGFPIDNTQLFVLDNRLRPLPVGLFGQLHIGGPGLARGYLGRASRTAERFVPHPFSRRPGERLYRTGDQAHYRPDGSIEFLGRTDNQVKIRGYRVELGEVEAALSRHPSVQSAAVVCRHQSPAGNSLAAFLTPKASPTEEEGVLSFLREQLPEYMVPSLLAWLEALPLTPNGKVDREALLTLDAPGSRDQGSAAPATPVEELLAGIWSHILGVERVGREDDFFELGGHSLLAAQVLNRIRRTFGLDLDMQAVFDAPRLSALARILEEAARLPGEDLAAPPLRRSESRAGLPLSFAQQRLWFLDQLEPGSPLYNIPAAFRLTGPLNIPVMEAALNEVLRRHEVLRTRFPAHQGKALLSVRDESLWLPLLDLSGPPAARRDEELQRLIRDDSSRPFDLASDPLLRMHLVRLADREYALLVNMHHIVSDEWSTGILVRELTTLYPAFCCGRPSPLPELEIQYADYAAWQHQWLAGSRLRGQLDYWRQKLGNQLPLELPADRPRSALSSSRGAVEFFALPQDLMESLTALSRRCGSTLDMTLLAAFQTLLYRCSSQSDISVGIPLANRNRAETEDLIGCFINTLVLRTDLSGDPGFVHLIGRVRQVSLQAYAHQDVPFEQVVEAVQPERSLGREPLFQVMFDLHNTPEASLELEGIEITPIPVQTTSSKFDLELTLKEDGQGAAEYSLDLFDPSTIHRLLNQWQRLLESIAANPQQAIGSLPFLNRAEKHQLLLEWNDTAFGYPDRSCLDSLFEAQLRRWPDAAVVACRGRWLSCAQLDARANGMAHQLALQGVGPERVAALLGRRSPEFLTAMLAIFKTGAAYLPLDPEHPPKRMAQVLDQVGSHLQIVVSDASSLPLAGQALDEMGQGSRPLLKGLEEALAQGASNGPDGAPSRREHLAYVIFTSGTTGRPKGAMLDQAGMLNHFFGLARGLGLGGSDVMAQTAPQCFDVSVWQFLSPLLTGGRVEVFPTEWMQDPGRLLEALEESAITVVQTVPSLMRLLLDHAASGSKPRHPLKALRWFIPGGEALPPEVCRRWLESYPQVPLMNAYGPTECSDTVTCHIVGPALPAEEMRVSIGRPIANLGIWVVDPLLQTVPIGVAGEFCVSGAGVGRGYLGDPGRTAEVFVPCPFVSQPGNRMYRTGDLARCLPDGRIDFLGRIDFQVKLRGFRIELGEIDAVLEQHPEVRQAASIVREDLPGVRRLVTYVTAKAPRELESKGCIRNGQAGGPNGTGRDAQAVSQSGLRQYLSERLPKYSVPSAVVMLEALPLTPNGKLDRKALPVPEAPEPDPKLGLDAPQTETEKRLAEIWAQLLNLKQVGAYDNFFELGGDSILSIQAIARARQAGILLTPRQLFQHPTVAGLAQLATFSTGTQAEQGPVTGRLPLTPIQQWFFQEVATDLHHWNQSVLLEVLSPLSADILEKAVEALQVHHDALRLRFQRRDPGWQQFIEAAQIPVPFSRVDLSAPNDSQRPGILWAATLSLQASLDLQSGPIFRVAWFDFGQDSPARLFIAIHHLAVDGVSWRILLEDLQLICGQIARGESPQLPAKTTSFKYWAKSLLKHAALPQLQDEASFWLSPRQSLSATSLPVDYPKGLNSEASARTVTASLSEDETSALLREVPQAYSTQINDVLLTALVRTFSDWTGGRSLRLLMEGHGREEIFQEADLSRTVGWFTVEFPLILELDKASLDGALKSVKEQLRAVPNKGLGYGLLRYLGADRNLRRQLAALPGAEISFNYLGQFDQNWPDSSPFRPAKGSVGPDHSPREMRKYLIEVDSGVSQGRLRVEWTYSQNLHRRSSIENLSRHYFESLRQLIDHCRSLSERAFTPSDFPEMGFSQEDLDELVEGLSAAFEEKP